jgi:hypothetical protein
MNFIWRIAQHPRIPGHNRREDRLTEVVAALFESPHCKGLAWEVIRRLLEASEIELASMMSAGHDDSPSREGVGPIPSEIVTLLGDDPTAWRCQVRTQVHATVDEDLRRPDLVLTFTPSKQATTSVERIAICIEAKQGTRPRRRQLYAYQRWLRDQGIDNGLVVLVGPRNRYSTYDPTEIPDNVPRKSWQQMAQVLNRVVCTDPIRTDRIRAYLVREVCDYLAMEDLVDPDVITPLHLAVLAERPTAEQAIARACEMVGECITRDWNDLARYEGDPRKPRFGVGYWETYPACRRRDDQDDWGGAWWGWHLRPDDYSLPESRGVPVFGTGIASEGPIVIGAAGESWLKALNGRLTDKTTPLDKATPFLAYEDGRLYHVQRVAYPEEVLIGRTLQQQAEYVAAWIIETYDMLHEAGPPPVPEANRPQA